eukprot:scaffold82598_cov59-Phaeocystis_antarctica.AAC.2
MPPVNMLARSASLRLETPPRASRSASRSSLFAAAMAIAAMAAPGELSIWRSTAALRISVWMVATTSAARPGGAFGPRFKRDAASRFIETTRRCMRGSS